MDARQQPRQAGGVRITMAGEQSPRVDVAALERADLPGLVPAPHATPSAGPPREVIVQGHCHHKAIMTLDGENEMLTAWNTELRRHHDPATGLPLLSP